MFDLPKECLVNKFIPKKTFYEKINISNFLKQEFIDKIDKITWLYKISEHNINISKTEKVIEIEVFELNLKEKYNSKNIVKIITKEIPYPILFLIRYEDEFQYAIKYDDTIYYSDWNNDITFNFIDFNLENVYENIVKSVTNIDNKNENIAKELAKIQEIEKIEKEIDRLKTELKKEQQFNKKVELNRKILELNNKKEEIKNNG